jgi:two-component system response regulator FixJ
MPDNLPFVPGSDPLRNKIFVVDDDPLVRGGLEITLSLAGFEVLKFASAEQFLEYLTPGESGCALIDIRMPDMDGLELQEELSRRDAPVSVVVMTGYADVPLAVRAMKAGALDILEKPFGNERLIAQVHSALPIAREKAVRALARQSHARELDSLSNRERDVMNLLVEGNSSKEIALALDISPRTVDIHRARVMEKMQVKSLPALLRKMALLA